MGVGVKSLRLGCSTWMLETGNGQRMGIRQDVGSRFPECYADPRQVLHFSTAGQWMWEEIKVSIHPVSSGVSPDREDSRSHGQRNEADAEDEEEEWKRGDAMRRVCPIQCGTPSGDSGRQGAGVDIVVRYGNSGRECAWSGATGLFGLLVTLMRDARRRKRGRGVGKE